MCFAVRAILCSHFLCTRCVGAVELKEEEDHKWFAQCSRKCDRALLRKGSLPRCYEEESELSAQNMIRQTCYRDRGESGGIFVVCVAFGTVAGPAEHTQSNSKPIRRHVRQVLVKPPICDCPRGERNQAHSLTHAQQKKTHAHYIITRCDDRPSLAAVHRQREQLLLLLFLLGRNDKNCRIADLYRNYRALAGFGMAVLYTYKKTLC